MIYKYFSLLYKVKWSREGENFTRAHACSQCFDLLTNLSIIFKGGVAYFICEMGGLPYVVWPKLKWI
jgi:hypothetical protein